MTFSLLGRCARTGQIGAAGATSNIGVGARIQHIAAGVGAVLTQHRTDPRLGPRGVALLRSGCSAGETLDALIASTPHHGWRQLAALDAAGRTAHFHGARVKPAHGHAHGPEGESNGVAIGNILANDDVPAAMIAAFARNPGDDLADRLLSALQAGEDAGGEHGPVLSAVLEVHGEHDFPLVDLRVDRAENPIAVLAALYRDYAPSIGEFVLRATDPDRARGG